MNLPIPSVSCSSLRWLSCATTKPTSCSCFSRFKSGIRYSPLLHEFKHWNTKEKVITENVQVRAPTSTISAQSNYFNEKNAKNTIFFLNKEMSPHARHVVFWLLPFSVEGMLPTTSSVLQLQPRGSGPLNPPVCLQSPKQTPALGHEGITRSSAGRG